MNVNVAVEKGYWSDAFLRNIGNCGVNITREDDAEILVRTARSLTQHDLENGKKIVFIEKTDGANIAFKDILRHDAIVRYVKQYNYLNLSSHNAPCVDERLFTRYLTKQTELNIPHTIVSELDIQKIFMGWCFLDSDGLRNYVAVDGRLLETNDRPIDVFFGGTVMYDNTDGKRKSGDLISEHRKNCLEKLRKIKHLHVLAIEGKVLERRVFQQVLQNSKIVISPWGWGEACFRDYEALLSGCAVIKPRTNFIKSTCNTFSNGSFIWCEPDFSDLAILIQHIHANWKTIRQNLHEQRMKLVERAGNDNGIVRSIFDL